MERPNTEQSSRIRPGVIVVVIAILGLLVAGITLGWFGQSQKTDTNAEAPAATDNPDTASAAPGHPPNPAALVVRPSERGAPPVVATAPGQSVPPALGALVPGQLLKSGEWEQRLDDILGANDEEVQKATKLLEMFPLLAEDGQIEVAQHLSNLLPDDRYAALGQSLTNAATPDGVLEVLMTDVLNRGNALKLPTLLQVARTPNHPKAEEARDVLEVFVDENYGTDWSKWEKAIQDWIKANPDEPAEEPTK